MPKKIYRSMDDRWRMNRRNFLKSGGIVGAGLVLGRPTVWAGEQQDGKPQRPATNIDDAMKTTRGPHAIPGPFPGRVVEIHDEKAFTEKNVDAAVVKNMFQSGLTRLTGQNMQKSFALFFEKNDIVGIKVNPVGAGLISTRLEVVDAVVEWLERNGLPRSQMVIWDRFDYMLKDAGFTAERYPGIAIEGLQTMDEAAAEGKTDDDSRWLAADGTHVSMGQFDRDVYYWADVPAPQDRNYLNQHVVNDQYSYFGKLLTQKLTKIINIPVFKNTGNGISMATKNLGYAAVCNTGRLHKPLFFDVCTEVLAFAPIRDKLVLNITDGLRGQYDGGPGPNAQFTFKHNRLYFATDPFAVDLVCHHQLVNIRKAREVRVDEHPRYTEYLRYGQRLGLGVADPKKIEHVQA